MSQARVNRKTIILVGQGRNKLKIRRKAQGDMNVEVGVRCKMGSGQDKELV